MYICIYVCVYVFVLVIWSYGLRYLGLRVKKTWKWLSLHRTPFPAPGEPLRPRTRRPGWHTVWGQRLSDPLDLRSCEPSHSQ